jgi:hypothetical protein
LKEHALNKAPAASSFSGDRVAPLFAFPSEPVLPAGGDRQVERMTTTTATATERSGTGELRATALLFGLVLIIPALLGLALLGFR